MNEWNGCEDTMNAVVDSLKNVDKSSTKEAMGEPEENS